VRDNFFDRPLDERRAEFENRLAQALAARKGEGEMTGPKPAGRPWTPEDDRLLQELFKLRMKTALIAFKMKRTIGAIQTRKNVLGLKAKGK
jgi:hypothetical protein